MILIPRKIVGSNNVYVAEYSVWDIDNCALYLVKFFLRKIYHMKLRRRFPYSDLVTISPRIWFKRAWFYLELQRKPGTVPDSVTCSIV